MPVTVNTQLPDELPLISENTWWIKFHQINGKTYDMTLQNTLTIHPLARLLETIGRHLSSLADQREKRAVYDRVWRELSAMSHREQADIGIHSSDIPRIASEAAAMSRKK